MSFWPYRQYLASSLTLIYSVLMLSRPLVSGSISAEFFHLLLTLLKLFCGTPEMHLNCLKCRYNTLGTGKFLLLFGDASLAIRPISTKEKQSNHTSYSLYTCSRVSLINCRNHNLQLQLQHLTAHISTIYTNSKAARVTHILGLLKTSTQTSHSKCPCTFFSRSKGSKPLFMQIY